MKQHKTQSVPCPACGKPGTMPGLARHVYTQHPQWSRRNDLKAYVDKQLAALQATGKSKPNGAAVRKVASPAQQAELALPVESPHARKYLEEAIAQIRGRRELVAAELHHLSELQAEDSNLAHQEAVLRRAVEELKGAREEAGSAPQSEGSPEHPATEAQPAA